MLTNPECTSCDYCLASHRNTLGFCDLKILCLIAMIWGLAFPACYERQASGVECRKGDVLVCSRNTNLQHRGRDGGVITTVLPKRTIVRVCNSQTRPFSLDEHHWLLVSPIDPAIDCEPGWVCPSSTANISWILRYYPHLPQYDVGEMPEQIRRSSAETQAKWKEVQLSVARSHESGTPEPADLVKRARIWSAVHNSQKAFEDYLEAARIALEGAASEDELVARSLYVLRLYETIERVSPEPPYLSISEPAFSQGGGEHFALAYTSFWNGRYEEAVSALDTALSVNPYEPVYSYYRALSKLRLGDKEGAEHDAKVGAFWEHQVRAAGQGHFVVIGSGYIGNGLERVQGEWRFWLESHRFLALNKDYSLQRSHDPREFITR